MFPRQMSQREHAEDPIWWSIKDATSFAAHRRTIVLFLASQPESLIWVDNTGAVWPELRDVLSKNNITRIAMNIDRNIAFGAGLHVGEKEALIDELGVEWMSGKIVNEPMLGVEYVATRVPGQIEYYRQMQETTWALIEEAFSERVVEVGITSTEVGLCIIRTRQYSYPTDGTRNVGRRMVVPRKNARAECDHLESTQSLRPHPIIFPRLGGF